jgi:hypothetical protein
MIFNGWFWGVPQHHRRPPCGRMNKNNYQLQTDVKTSVPICDVRSRVQYCKSIVPYHFEKRFNHFFTTLWPLNSCDSLTPLKSLGSSFFHSSHQPKSRWDTVHPPLSILRTEKAVSPFALWIWSLQLSWSDLQWARSRPTTCSVCNVQTNYKYILSIFPKFKICNATYAKNDSKATNMVWQPKVTQSHMSQKNLYERDAR